MSDPAYEWFEADVDDGVVPLFGRMSRQDMFGLPVLVFTQPEFMVRIGHDALRFREHVAVVFPHKINRMTPLSEERMMEKVRRWAAHFPDSWEADPSFCPGNPAYDEFMARGA